MPGRRLINKMVQVLRQARAFDVPAVEPVFTEEPIESVTCQCCGKVSATYELKIISMSFATQDDISRIETRQNVFACPACNSISLR